MREREYLAQADRFIAECGNRINRQREVIASAFQKGHATEVPVSMLRALEASLRAFEGHRLLIVDRQKKTRSGDRSITRPRLPGPAYPAGKGEAEEVMTRPFWIWHTHLGKYGDPKAMSCVEIPCSALWFWAAQGDLCTQADNYLRSTHLPELK